VSDENPFGENEAEAGARLVLDVLQLLVFALALTLLALVSYGQ
jgi:hypothetical protein